MPQYENEPAEAYFETYTDNIITGSMLPDGLRGSVGSKISGSFEYKTATDLATFKRTFQNGASGSSFQRNLQLFSSKETILDSITPNYLDIFAINGGQFIYSLFDKPSFPPYPVIQLLISYRGQPITSSNLVNLTDNRWFQTFPFQYEYINARRTAIKPNDSILPLFSESVVGTQLEYTPIANLGAIQSSRTNNFYIGVNIGNNINNFTLSKFVNVSGSVVGTSFVTNSILLQLDAPEFNRFIFGADFLGDDSNLMGADTSTSNAFIASASVPRIRGWKYGLYNAFPQKTSVIFRRGKFGQLRDILEQRILTTTIDLTTNITKNPLLIIFASGTSDFITASNPALNTHGSGLFDKFYRSNKPFFDV